MRRALGVACAFLLGCGCGCAWAQVERRGSGAYHLPDGLKKTESLPIFVVEASLAEQSGFAAALKDKLRAVIIEMPNMRGARPDAEKVRQTLSTAVAGARDFFELKGSPVFPIGFSAFGDTTCQAAAAAAKDHAGLILINTSINTRGRAEEFARAKALPVLVLHGTRDPVFPLNLAEAFVAAMKAAGMKVDLHKVETSDHFKPFSLGIDEIVKFAKANGAKAGKGPDDKAEAPKFAPAGSPKTISVAAGDGVKITADLYEAGGQEGPLVLLFHMAGGSRGEYVKLAPRLVKEGFSCLAVDLRSGKGGAAFAGIANETARAATAAGKPTAFLDAYPDMQKSIQWARELGYKGKLFLLGSSYSSSLALIAGSESKDELAGVVACSPGEYLPEKGRVSRAAAASRFPVCATYAKAEAGTCEAVAKAVPEKSRTLWVQEQGDHGSRAFEAADGERSFAELLKFLRAR